MRLLRYLPFLLILPAGSSLVEGRDGARAPQAPSPAMIARAQDQDLEAKFAELRRVSSLEEAQRIEAEIYTRLATAPSPTINALMEAAAAAGQSGDDTLAQPILDDIARLAPDFAEGLTRAAAGHYNAGDLDQAEQLLTRALRAEPRHFAAWTGLAVVLEDKGDLAGAAHAYREALYYYPLLDAAKRGLIRVEAKSSGLSL